MTPPGGTTCRWGARAMTVVRVLFVTLSDVKAREEIPTDVR